MIAKSLRIFARAMLLLVVVGAKASDAEELFKKAAIFYGRNYGSQPWPANNPSGFQLLTAAAEANYPPALFNMFLGYQFGFFEYADEAKAKEYRIKWLIALDTPSSCLEVARGFLGIWSTIPDPLARKESVQEGCIFTGEIVRKERRPSVTDFKFFGADNQHQRDERRALSFFIRTVDLGLSRDAQGSGRQAATEAATVLADAVLGNAIQGGKGQKLQIAEENIRRGEVLRTLLLATREKVGEAEKVLPATLKLFDSLSNEEISKSFSEK